MNNLQRTALVTGAGRGIGRQIALSLAQDQIDLALVARSNDEILQTAEEVRKFGVQAIAMVADVSRVQDVRDAVAEMLAKFGQIDILVNNAGAQFPIGPLVDNDSTEWTQAVAINLFGTAFFIQSVLPNMISRRRGKIINLSGGGATSPRPNFTAYAASKAAVVRLTECVAEEVREYNIQVNAIAPGAINTRMLDEVISAGNAAGSELKDALKRKEVGGNSLETVGHLVQFLVSDAANGLTGKLISAPHDDWRVWDATRIESLANSAWYTLRRLDPFTLDSLTELAK